MSREYFVPFSDAQSEFVEKRSRFIGNVYRVESEEEIKLRLEEIRKKHYDARHHCWCCILHSGLVRCSDAGEPQGTAGQPMLNVFEHEGVENVLCIATRYFGGILLGAGGLSRAYGKTAKDALDAAGKARMQPYAILRLFCPYPLFERFKLMFAEHKGILEKADYAEHIDVTLRLPAQEETAFAADLKELSLGSVSYEKVQELFLPGERE